MNESAIPINRDKIRLFCKKHHIANLALFGSILTSYFGPKSDVDILVNFDSEHIPNFFDLIDQGVQVLQSSTNQYPQDIDEEKFTKYERS